MQILNEPSYLQLIIHLLLITHDTSPPGEGGLAVTALVLLVSGVQLDMTVPGTLVLEQTTTELTAERQLVGMGLNEKHSVNTVYEIPINLHILHTIRQDD